MISSKRLEELLAAFPAVRIAVLGDFFLDQYWEVDPDRTEVSLETGLPAYQVDGIRLSPGAAGTIVNNLVTMGAGEIRAVGFLGDDGNGFELERRLARAGVCTKCLVVTPDRKTPVYTKPMFGETEGSRFDIKNRLPTPTEVEEEVILRLRSAVSSSDVIMTQDQVQEPDCGVVTTRVRMALAGLAQEFPGKAFVADSRTRIGEFREVMLKPNRIESQSAVPDAKDDADAARRLSELCHRPVFLTRGAQGILIYDGREQLDIPAVRLEGPLDPVGAGDTCSAALVLALASGASLEEAAILGILAASVTIRKLGTTGTASPEEILAVAQEYRLQRK